MFIWQTLCDRRSSCCGARTRSHPARAREEQHDMLTTLATLAAVTLALPQQGEGRGQGQGQGSGDTTVAVQQGARLDVNNFGGEIVVHTWTQNNVRVRASHSSRSKVDVSTSSSTVLVRSVGRRGPPSDRAHQDGAAGRRYIDFAAARVAGAHAHVVLSPGVHDDLAAEVIDVEPGALLDRDRRVAAALSLSLSAPLSLLRESECDGG